MPAINTTVYPLSARVRVEINWADVPTVDCARVVRVNADASETPLRAYVAPCLEFGEGYIQLSDHRAIFWDTEVPLDASFTYRTEGAEYTFPVPPGPTTTGPLTVASDGDFWLRDPVRPCHDARITLCWDPNPACLPAEGIFLAENGAETYGSVGGSFLPTNSSLPVSINRTRVAAAAGHTMVTRMFSDRDRLLTLLAPGTELMLVGPPDYGIPDRYVNYGDVQVSRALPDHRYQPRLFTMPYTTTARPVGTSQGICGARFADLCDVYPTWNAMASAGLLYGDLLRGAAAPPPPTGRTWLAVENGFANWGAVKAGGRTWSQLKAGG